MNSHRLRQINIVLLCAFFAACIYYWNKLPSRLPLHYGATGRADYAPVSTTLWFALPCVAVALSVLMYGLCCYAEANPQTWNTPNRAAFLHSSPAEHEPIYEMLRRGLTWTAIISTVLFAYLQAVTLIVGMRKLPAIPTELNLVTSVLAAAVIAAPIFFVFRATRLIEKIEPHA